MEDPPALMDADRENPNAMETTRADLRSVGREPSTPPRARACFALVNAAVAALLGGLGLLGWVTPWRRLASLIPQSIPMAPSTALAALILGGVLMLRARQWSPRLATAVALLVFLFSSFQLGSFVSGRPLAIDVALVPAPASFGAVLTGRMSPLTAIGLTLVSLSFLFASVGRHRTGNARLERAFAGTSVALALVASLFGFVILLGYVFGAPLLYGSPVVPMALSTAQATLCLGLALLALAPPDSALLRAFSGSSIRFRLMRAFLPVVPAIIGVELLFDRVEGLSPGLHAALTAIASAIVLAVLAGYRARWVGLELERAEAGREQARIDAERLAAIVDSSDDAIYAMSMDGKILAWNPSAERLFGYARDEAVGHTLKALVAPGAEHRLDELLARIAGGERIVHHSSVRVRKDGTSMAVSVSESPLHDAEGHVIGVSVIANDLSEWMRAEEALRKSEASFRELADAMPQMVWITGPDGRSTYFNRRWMDFTGLTLEESLSEGWIRPFHPEDRQRALDSWQRATATVGTYSLEVRLRRKDGAYSWWLVRGVPTLDDAGDVVKWYGTCTDIDDRIQAERRISDSEERFSKIFHSGLTALSISETISGRVIDVNERWAKLFGFAREEMIGRTVLELGLWAGAAERERFVAGASVGGSRSETESSFRRKSGEVFPALVAADLVTLTGSSEQLMVTALVDLTELKQLEAQFLQAQKTEAVGLLAGGIAHEFNNALAIVQGYAELLLGDVDSNGTDRRGGLEQILKASEHASSLTKELLAFSREQVVEARTLDLTALLSNLEKMLRRLIGEDIGFAFLPGVDLGRVKADPGQLEQVIVNLCVNSKQAMPEGGSLRIESANVEVDELEQTGIGTSSTRNVAPGRYVMLTVRDTGCGIAREILPRVFDPFFTTKGVGKGTGLGLSMVYGSIKQAGGYVWMESEVGRGTTARIYLPRVDEPALALADDTAAAASTT